MPWPIKGEVLTFHIEERRVHCSAVLTHNVEMSTVSVTASGYLHPFEDVVFSCGSLECLENDPDRLSSKGMWAEVLSSTLIRLRPARCDFCFLDVVHQSLCKTKNYCSKRESRWRRGRSRYWLRLELYFTECTVYLRPSKLCIF